MRALPIAWLSLVLALGSGSPAAVAGETPTAALALASAQSRHEQSAAEIAAKRALVPSIRALAARIADDSAALQRRVTEFAHRRRLELEAANGAPLALHDKQGPAFDRAYMAAMVDSHKTVLAALQPYTDADDEALARIARESSAVLNAHLDSAMAIRERLAGLGIKTD